MFAQLIQQLRLICSLENCEPLSFYCDFFIQQVVKNSQDLGHRQILEAQSYGKAKQLATDYQKTKSMLYKRLQETGYGSWELMQKPPEMSQFS